MNLSAWVSPSGKIIKCGWTEHIQTAYEISTGEEFPDRGLIRNFRNHEQDLMKKGWIKISNDVVYFEKCNQKQLNVLFDIVSKKYIDEMIKFLDETRG